MKRIAVSQTKDIQDEQYGSSKPATGKRESLRRHLLIRLSLVLSVAFLLSMLAILFWVRPNVTRTQMERNRWHAYFIAQALDNQLERHAKDVKAAAVLLDAMQRMHQDLEADEVRSMLQELVEEDSSLENLMVLDLYGRVLYAPLSKTAYEALDLSRSTWFIADMPENQIVWSQVQFTALSSRPASICVFRKGQNLYVGTVQLLKLDQMVREMRMPDGTHVHVFDQKNMTVVGHDIEETFTRSFAQHLPEEGFTAAEGSYAFSDGEETFFAEYFRLSKSGWVVAVMTSQTSVWKTVWVFIDGVSGMLLLIVAAIVLLVWRSNNTWMKEFAAIERLLHRIAAQEDQENLEENAEETDMAVVPSVREREADEPALRFTDFDSLIRDFSQLMDTAHIAEEEAREKAAEAEQADQAKNRFIRNISQEIRNPLGGILGASDLLLFRETDPEKRERLRLLRQSAEVLRHTMDDVLEIANMEGGRFHFEEGEVQIHRILEDLVQQYANAAEKKGLELSLRWVRSVPQKLRGDGMRIRQILSNLVENALKFTEEGVIRISSHVETIAGDVVHVRFAVRDTGVGIPADETEKVFWEFHQVESNRANGRTRGVGLGLSVSRRLVTAMGGEIGVESDVGQGSLFWFTLPLFRTGKEVGEPDGNT